MTTATKPGPADSRKASDDLLHRMAAGTAGWGVWRWEPDPKRPRLEMFRPDTRSIYCVPWADVAGGSRFLEMLVLLEAEAWMTPEHLGWFVQAAVQIKRALRQRADDRAVARQSNDQAEPMTTAVARLTRPKTPTPMRRRRGGTVAAPDEPNLKGETR